MGGDESNVPIAGTKAAVRNVRAAASLDGGGILRADGDNVGGDIGNAVSVSKADVLRRWGASSHHTPSSMIAPSMSSMYAERSSRKPLTTPWPGPCFMVWPPYALGRVYGFDAPMCRYAGWPAP